MELIVNENNLRLDSYISQNTEYSRSKAQKYIKENKIKVNGKNVSPSYILKQNDIVFIEDIEEDVLDLIPEKMDIDIVYEDEYLAIINKKSGVVVHPAAGNYNHTLVNGLLYHFNQISKDKSIRPGIVHRLDKDTSGLMIVAKNDLIHDKLSLMIKNKKVERKYLALVWGVLMHDNGTIDAPIGRDLNNRQRYVVTDINSKDSVTHFKVIDRFKDATLIECKLQTGRTHQIRVHMNYISHPIVNDLVYGNKKIFDENFGQMLHSKSIKFVHPVTKEEIYFEVDAPKEFYKVLENFKD